MRLLLIEDDLKIATFISKGLKEAGFVIEHTNDGNTGLQMALTATYDAALIDIMLPGMDGLLIIEQLRQQKIKLPVIGTLVRVIQGFDGFQYQPFLFPRLEPRSG